ncbi:hypothetical protein CDL15_Pgr021178 [Punica granatum]|uniref:Uncharacterized protein n=1 Tax=Punica granatum TaxID=22663 RepID=A0A218VSN6_PUNGR|nr:hypothetical protein CDL15_Pgr021178 [Punica granatum]
MSFCRIGPLFPGSGSTREIKMNPETQSESCSMVLVVLGCVQACFRVPFTCPQIGRPGSPFKKASANAQKCLGLSRRLLKCARRCHWSFWPCPHVRTFAPGCQVMSNSLSLDPTFLSLEPVDQNGVLTPKNQKSIRKKGGG